MLNDPLTDNISAQIAILGGGMSGVTCAHAFAEAGFETVLIEQRSIADGSTSSNTGLLQFSSDIMLCELKEQIGEAPAERFYGSSKEALDRIAQLASRLPVDVEFKRRSSLYFASSEQDLPKLRREYEALLHCGFDVEYWSAEEIGRHFPFRKPGALVTHADAEINPLKFVFAMADEATANGLRIFEQTEVVRHETLTGARHRLHASNGCTIDAEYVVYAVGYEPEALRGKLRKADLNRSYVIVTDGQSDLSSWHNRFLIWETARPYLYMRTTLDNRIIIGGLDEDQEQPVHSSRKLADKGEQLLARFSSLFPGIRAEIDFAWNATFGESLDHLPFIGEDPACPGVYYNLGYGGNGSVCCMLGAQIILGMIKDKTPHPLPFIGMRDFAEQR
nr:FAD-dependent oxidoreductase [Paenibacillus soyae]